MTTEQTTGNLRAGRYRKKPVVIDAVQWDGVHIEPVLALVDFDNLPDDGSGHVNRGIGHTPALGTLDIPTLEGTMTAQPGDWIIRGVQGEVYPCKPDIFEATYEPADTSSEARLPHADVPGLTPETCPERDSHGSPFRYCHVKGCGWHDGMQSDNKEPT